MSRRRRADVDGDGGRPVQQSLKGKQIVVTRPEAQADGLCEAIALRGGRALRFPVLGIAPPADLTPLIDICERLEDIDLAFFVSPNAVDFALSFILARRSWPAQVAVATVGGGSERALQRFGFNRIIVPASGFDSESVLVLPAFSAPAIVGKRVVIFRGDGGRDLFGSELSQRGAEVEYVTAYHRFCPDTDCADLIALARAGDIDAMVLTSSEGVRNLADMLGEKGMTAVDGIPVYAPHSRIAGFALEAGFRRVVETDGGDAGIIRGLEAGLAEASPAGQATPR